MSDEVSQLAQAPLLFAYERKVHVAVPSGNMVIERVITVGKAPPDFSRFICNVKALTGIMVGGQEVEATRQDVPVPADSLAEAFDMLAKIVIEETAKLRTDALAEVQRRQKQIVVPSAGADPRLLFPRKL